MTVRVLPEEYKDYIAHLYVHENRTQAELAYEYRVSRRTIGRVLVECGVNKVQVNSSKPQPIVLTEQLPLPLVQDSQSPDQSQPQSLLQRIKAFFGRLFY
jgi:DNA-binding transcriptional regulator LsrR (DeoR family)